MKRLIAVAMLVIALIVVPLAGPASATSDSPQGWYTWSTSLKPGVTTPHDAGDVTWPQTLVGKGQVPPACEQWVQQDRYEGSDRAIEAVVGDGVLTYNERPEDSDIVKDWRFVYGGPCPAAEPEWSVTTPGCDQANKADLFLADSPRYGWTVNGTPTGAGQHTYTEPGTYVVLASTGDTWTFTLPAPKVCPTPTPTPTPEPTVHTERHVDCDLGVAIILTEYTYSDGTSRTVTEQGPLTDKEARECSTSTPTPTPTSKPSATPSPPQPSPTPTKAAPTSEPSPTSPTSTPPSKPSSPSTEPSSPVTAPKIPRLSETGSNVGEGLTVGGIISVTGVLLLLWARKRRRETA